MPVVSSRNHNWNNIDRNIPNMRNSIPPERQQIINRMRGVIDAEENNVSESEIESLNRQARRRLGDRNVSSGNSEVMNARYGNLVTLDCRGVTMDGQQLISSIDWSAYAGNMRIQSSYSPINLNNEMTFYSTACQQKPKHKYINSYNYIPNEFYYNKLESEEINQYFGIEIEVDKGGEIDDSAKEILDFLGENNIYIKHDGSLSAGFEIVTHPCTYNYHIEKMKYKKLFEKLVEMGYKAHDTTTCGLHIHINKTFFGDNKTYQDLNISKLLFLIEKYWDSIVTFSRRSSDGICRWAKRYEMKNNESMFDVLAKAKNAEMYSHGKYYAINLKHKDTVEFRVFKGTLKHETFIATLQLVKRLSETVKKLSLEEVQLITWEEIFKDCEVELNEYLKLKNLIQ